MEERLPRIALPEVQGVWPAGRTLRSSHILHWLMFYTKSTIVDITRFLDSPWKTQWCHPWRSSLHCSLLLFVAKLCPTLCNPMNCSASDSSVLHCLPDFAPTHAHWVGGAILPSHALLPPSIAFIQSFPASGSFPVSQLFISGGQRIGKASASASVLPINIQDWFPLGLTGWISLQSKRLSRVFSNTPVQKHLFFSDQSCLWANSHIHTWRLEKP